MAFCSNCGTSLKDGALFCHECGTRNTLQGPAPSPPQPVVSQASTPPAYQAPPPVEPPSPVQQPASPQIQYGPLKFEVTEKEMLKFVKVELDNSAFRYESGGLYYMLGNLEMVANMPSAGGLLKSMVTREHVVKPVIKGTGTVWLEPAFGEFTVMDLNQEEWILDRGAYIASEMSVNIDSFTNKSLSGLFSGEGFFQTKVSGPGKVVIYSSGPLETIELNNGKLVVDGSFAIARQASVQLTVSKASKGIFGTMISGEGIVNTFTGTGKIMIAPAANRHVTMINYLSSIHRRVMQIKNS